VSVDKKRTSPHYEWYIGNVLVCAHFSSILHGTYCVCSIMQLFRLLGIVKIFSHVNAQTLSLVALIIHDLSFNLK